MKKEKKAFVHEYSSFFCIQVESSDPRPFRSVSAVALKDNLPTFSVIEAALNVRKAGLFVVPDSFMVT